MASKAAAKAAQTAFRLISKHRCNGLVDVFRFRSERTGLRLTIADVNGPNVSGFFCLATETDSDDGLPHTLEHLIFMGSEKYPYKGLLDLVANRCLASGTNAWTATDHTCYTLTTAGSEGFLIMLPIYLDHIFHPLLTDAQYTTEVHHINGQGEDGGVVYCEMQEMESQMNSMVDWKFKERMWPPGCGYRAETGGRLPNLRTSTSNEKVRAFHAAYYHPRNCEVIITGPIEHEKIFEALEDVENTIVEKKLSDKPFTRPWTTPIPALNIPETNGSAVDEVVITCPSDDGKAGVVMIGWRGPPIKDYYEYMAVDILLDYLADTAASPLERDFIQIADPYCASINAYMEEYAQSCIKVDFVGAKADKLQQIRNRLMETLEKIGSGEEDFDSARMDDILRKAGLKAENELETGPHHSIASAIISDFLYSTSDAETEARLDVVAIYKKMRSEPKTFWVDLIRKYMNRRRPHVCIIGDPSQDLVQKLSEAEKQRIAAQKKRLGEKGLEACETVLNMAVEENDKNQPPDELINRCIVETLEGIKFFDVHSTTNRSKDEDGNARFPLSKLPCTAVLNDCAGTGFVDMNLILDTSTVGPDRKPLMFLWSNLLFESPIARNGDMVPYDKIVKELNRDLVSYEVGAGIKGSFLRLMALNVKVDVERYKNAVNWSRELMYDTKFSSERISVVAQRLINLAAEYKRDGFTVAQLLIDTLTYEAGSPPLLHNVILQEKYLKELLGRLEKDPNKVIADFETLRDDISAPDRLVLNVLCETDRVKKKDSKPEEAFVNNLLPKQKMSQGNRAKINGNEPTFVKPVSEFGQGIIASVGSCESCYVFQNTPCTLRYEDADLPALRVLLQYLDQAEGPLWREIRGRGLAYGVYTSLLVDLGLLQFALYRTSDPVLAYDESKRVILEHLRTAESFDEDEFDAAKRSLIFQIIAKEATIKKASQQALLSYYRGIPRDYNRQLLKRIWDVEMDELPIVGEKYLAPLFECRSSNAAISCHPSKLNEVVEGFKKFGREFKVVTLEDDALYKF